MVARPWFRSRAFLLVTSSRVFPALRYWTNLRAEVASLPLAFESNQGQIPARYQFAARRNSMQTFFAADGVDVFLTGKGPTSSVVHITWDELKRRPFSLARKHYLAIQTICVAQTKLSG